MRRSKDTLSSQPKVSCFLLSFLKTRDELKKKICNDCLIRKFGEENEKLDVLINNAGSESNK